ncbi:MAG: xanthine phosphoribosyltransferase [Oscillospiraceae bacterium]|jgi:xanthine phosphoribosyltransferase|nr:xanthine phosphoribosyltransferase [Oscillospiraceae bacterium]
MQLLKDRILTDGQVETGGVLKVDGFLNHRIDVCLLEEIGKEFRRIFEGEGITKILTIEASGIAIAVETARFFRIPVVFAKKNQSINIAGDVFATKVESFTHGKTYDVVVSKKFLSPEDNILIIDDFLANGSALLGLVSLVRDSGASLAGAGIVIEKAFQSGGDIVRGLGVRVESLARILDMSGGEIVFAD